MSTELQAWAYEMSESDMDWWRMVHDDNSRTPLDVREHQRDNERINRAQYNMVCAWYGERGVESFYDTPYPDWLNMPDSLMDTERAAHNATACFTMEHWPDDYHELSDPFFKAREA